MVELRKFVILCSEIEIDQIPRYDLRRLKYLKFKIITEFGTGQEMSLEATNKVLEQVNIATSSMSVSAIPRHQLIWWKDLPLSKRIQDQSEIKLGRPWSLLRHSVVFASPFAANWQVLLYPPGGRISEIGLS